MKIKEFNPTGDPNNDPIDGGWSITDDIRPYVSDSAVKTKKKAEALKSQLRPELQKLAEIREVNVRYVHVSGDNVSFTTGKRWAILLPANT